MYVYGYVHACTHIYCILYLGQLVWKCNVSEAIVHEACRFKVEDDTMTVTLKKQKPGLWKSLYKVCMYLKFEKVV